MGAQGTATIDFGAFPGSSDASVVVTGQAGIVSGSLVEAWVRLVATADHSADEHMLETFNVFAGNIVAGTGFTIYAINTSQFNEPLEGSALVGGVNPATNTAGSAVGGPQGGLSPSRGGKGTRLWGLWSLAWVWN